MILYLLAYAAVAITVPGFVFAVRALPWVARQVDAAVKPWACDICMGFWSTGIFSLVAVALSRDPWMLLVAGPAYTTALLVLSFLERPTGAPPPLE